MKTLFRASRDTHHFWHNPFFDLVALWIRLRGLFFVIGMLLVAVAMPLSARLPVDRSLLHMLAANDPERKIWSEFEQIFGTQDFVLIAYRDTQLFAASGEGIARLSEVAQRLRAVSGVKDVWSLDQLLGPAIVSRSSLAESVRHLFENYTHNALGNVAAVIVLIDPLSDHGEAQRATAIDQLTAIASSLPEGVIVGPPVVVETGFRMVERDGSRIAWTAGILLAGVILICSGQLRWVLIAAMLITTSVTGAKATFAILGGSGNLIDSALVAVITVIAVATLMHLVVRVENARWRGHSAESALHASTRQLTLPVMLALATDAIGFGALTVSGVTPVRSFAVVAVLAVGWLLIAMLCFLPATFMGAEKIAVRVRRETIRFFASSVFLRAETLRRSLTEAGPLQAVLQGVLKVSLRHRWRVVTTAIVLMAASLWGWLRAKYETDFTRSFREDSSIVRAYEWLDQELGGAGVWDIALPAPGHLTPEYLAAVENLQNRLRTEVKIESQGRSVPGLAKVLSLADLRAALNSLPLPSAFSSRWTEDWALRFVQMRMPGLYRALYTADPREPTRWWFRILLRSQERETGESRVALVRQVRQIVEEEWPRIIQSWPHKEPSPAESRHEAQASFTGDSMTSRIGPLVTGYYVIFGELVRGLVVQQGLSFIIAIVGMALLFAVAFRNLTWVFGVLFANLLPVVVLMGTLGWIGVRINMGSAMMAAVSLGLSVDASIHYLTAFQRALKAGRSITRALREAQNTVGPATVYATLALVVGFLSLTRSQFVPTADFGILVSWTMVGGLVSNLVLLPCLLSFSKRHNISALRARWFSDNHPTK
ncbi:hypothetical protein [Thermogutta sp.]|uniref:efflux RND transporter permease subunit n=1 Tax=Thermogutta sp. TaxID=1962930 RepID=UPI003220014F